MSMTKAGKSVLGSVLMESSCVCSESGTGAPAATDPCAVPLALESPLPSCFYICVSMKSGCIFNAWSLLIEIASPPFFIMLSGV